jgi:ribosomal protein L37E
MTYTIVHHHVPYSTAIYTGIRCKVCGQTSYSLDDIEHKKCSLCGAVHNSSSTQKPNMTGTYRLFSGRSKKSTKLHWTINGANSLCNNPVGYEVKPTDPRAVCVNCDDLKRRGFYR